MRRLWVLLVLAFLLTSCASSLPAADWCFAYDFRNSNYGVTILYGQWIPGVGIRTDAGGRFAITYAHSSSVTPTGVIITATRATSVAAPTKVIVKADIFGVTARTVRTDVPADVNVADIQFAGGGGSDKFQITGEAGAPMQLVRIQVRGSGSNPFSTSNCDTAAINGDDEPQVDVGIPDQIGDALQDSDMALGAVDVDLAAPNGSPLLPTLAALITIFGYLKWVLSGTAASELAGPFAPLVSHMGIYLSMQFALFAIYAVIYAVVYIIRWVIWLFNTVVQIIQTISQIIASLPGWLIIAAIGIVAGLLVVIGTNFDGLKQSLLDLAQSIQDFIDSIIPG